jgi:hypothetical protein
MRLNAHRTLAASLMLTVLVPRVALSDEIHTQRGECADSYENSQTLRREGRLLAARDALLVCSHDPCDPDLKVDCEKWALDNEESIPSMVVTLHDREGHALTGARLVVDGRPIPGGLAGKKVELDPGEHEIRIEGAPWPVRIQKIVLPEGDKRHLVSLEPDRPPHSARPMWPAYLSGGVAVLGAVGVVGFGLEGLHVRSDSCPGGNCASQADYGSVKGWYVAADVSFGVAIAAAGVCATYLLLTRGNGSDKSAALDLGRGWTF